MRLKIIILTLIFLSGCDLLSTREPEDPTSSRSNFVSATTPGILFQNLKDSFSEKIVENYLACFVDQSFLEIGYSFIPSSGTISQYTVLADWTLSDERQYFNNVKAVSSQDIPITLELNNKVSNLSGESAIYQFEYALSIPTSDPTVPASYEGSVQFKINLDSRQIWVITEWQDISKENLPSWSELKGRFY